MKFIIILSLIMNICLNGSSQKIISAANPLEKILQNDFDSTILYSYSNRGYSYNYLIISKKDNSVYFYRYSSPLRSNLNNRDKAPNNTVTHSKLISNQLEFIDTKPNINNYFSWVGTKLLNESIWKDIEKYNLWNLIDDEKIDSLNDNCESTMDGGYLIFKLLTKNKITQLTYNNPLDKNKQCKFNQTRFDVIKIEQIILEYFNSIN